MGLTPIGPLDNYAIQINTFSLHNANYQMQLRQLVREYGWTDWTAEECGLPRQTAQWAVIHNEDEYAPS